MKAMLLLLFVCSLVSCQFLDTDGIIVDPLTGAYWQPGDGKNPGKVVITQDTWNLLAGLIGTQIPGGLPTAHQIPIYEISK